MTPQVAEVNALIAVAEQRSFTRAARTLGLSTARVSEMVRALEERLGVRLLERSTRSVSATPAGEGLIERLRPILEDYAAAFAMLDEFRDRPAGNLRLTVAPPAAHFLIGPRLADFLARYPDISVELSVDASFVDIVQARFDAGVRPGERIARDMIAVRIGDPMPFVIAAAPGYLAARGAPGHPRDLMAHDCVRFRFKTGERVKWRFLKQTRVVEVEIRSRLTVDDMQTGIAAALQGAGLIQLPRVYAASHLAAGTLAEVLHDWQQPVIDTMFLYYSSRRQMRPALRALIDYLRLP